MTIKSYLKKGNSFPIILEDEGKPYFVKLRAGMSGKYAMVNEWFGNQLGLELNIRTQKPRWINLSEEVIIEDIHLEVKELIYKSLGLNIAFPYQEQALEVTADELQQLDQKMCEATFLFDLMMLNVDRSFSNTNLMRVHDQVFSVDYESSLLFQDLAGNKRLFENVGILRCLKSNPLYQVFPPKAINDFLAKTEKISIKAILSAIPSNILTLKERNDFLKGIEERQSKQWYLQEMMDQLQSIQLETAAEQKTRMSKNQERFKRNLKKNTSKNKD